MRWSFVRTIWMPVACRASVASMWPSARAIGPVRTRLACSAADEPSIGAAIANIQHRIDKATSDDAVPPRLVAVSKTKPVELLREAYDAGQRDFGENYVQELVGKAPEMPDDVSWRFIGNLQSNKAKVLVHGVPSLAVVETLDSTKLADRLQRAVRDMSPPRAEPLGVMVQVNTSPWEGSKGGVLVEDASSLAAHVVGSCPDLQLVGLMTIGAPGDTGCFDTLRSCRDTVAAALDVAPETLELSMGMSGDFEAAVAKGSNSVRVGSSIFGARAYPPKT